MSNGRVEIKGKTFTLVWDVGISAFTIILIGSGINWLFGIEDLTGKVLVFTALFASWGLAWVLEILDQRFELTARIVSAVKGRDVKRLMTNGFGRRNP